MNVLIAQKSYGKNKIVIEEYDVNDSKAFSVILEGVDYKEDFSIRNKGFDEFIDIVEGDFDLNMISYLIEFSLLRFSFPPGYKLHKVAYLGFLRECSIIDEENKMLAEIPENQVADKKPQKF